MTHNSTDIESKERMQNYVMQIFHQCDAGHKEYLTREDLSVAAVSLLGYKLSKYELNQMMGTTGGNVNTKMGMQRFIELMVHRLNSVHEDDEIRNTFIAFDIQCRGFLTVEDLKRVFAQVAPHLPPHNIETAFREIDRDGDGRVSYKDFEFMMKYSLEDGF